MASDQGFLKISGPPDPFFHFLTSEQVLSFSDEFISSHLDVFVEQITSEELLSVLKVEHLGDQEGSSHDGLGDELEVLVVEENIVVIQEHETSSHQPHHLGLVEWVFNVQICHVIIPLWIVWVQHHSLEWESWSDSLDYIKQVKHLLNGLVSLLSHTSADESILVIVKVLTYELAGCPRRLRAKQ